MSAARPDAFVALAAVGVLVGVAFVATGALASGAALILIGAGWLILACV